MNCHVKLHGVVRKKYNQLKTTLKLILFYNSSGTFNQARIEGTVVLLEIADDVEDIEDIDVFNYFSKNIHFFINIIYRLKLKFFQIL